MRVIIPMAGLGSRFIAAGFQDIKPLIPVAGKPMIEWVCKVFPGSEFTFICRSEHLESTPLNDVLKRISPQCDIVSVPGDKPGPVSTLLQAGERVVYSEPVIVSYCDYYMHWDFADFLSTVNAAPEVSAWLPCYTGFHPHLIPEKNLYASVQVNEDMKLLKIREKYSFTQDKTLSLHSPGVHYFKSGELLLEMCQALEAEGPRVGGELYASMLYQKLLDKSSDVRVYNRISKFCQWGTPEDLQEFNYWMKEVGVSAN